MPSTHLMALCTTRCNLRCAHCVRGRPEEHSDLDPDLWARILDEGRKLGFTSAAFTGGEPCLHPCFDQMLETTVKKGYTFSITTNGILSEPYVRAFRKYGSPAFEYLKVSLDGLEQEHSAMRGGGNFGKTVSTLSIYKNLGIRFLVALCASKLNMDCMENFITFCHRQGYVNIEINPLITTSTNRSIVLNGGELERLRKTVDRTDKKLGTKTSKYTIDKQRRNCGIVFCNELVNPSLTINAMGDCIFCCATIENGAVAAQFANMSVADAYRRTLEMGSKIISRRISDLEDQKMTLDFNNCDYCNKVLREYIRPAGR